MTSDIFTSFMTNTIPRIDAELRNAITISTADHRDELIAAMNHSLLAPAKRIRPLLCLISHQLFNDNDKKIMPLAIAAEMIHTYSLIHDDLPAMDDDDIRRGQETCHKKFGEDIAILAGDTLNTLAFEHLAEELPKYFNATASLECIRLFAKSLGIFGMAGGQTLDIKATLPDHGDIFLEDMHRLKTGALIESCLTLPARLSDASGETITTLSYFSESLGLLFQVVDDILDDIGNPEMLGKTPGKDKEQNKCTYVTCLGLKKAEKKADELATNCLDYCSKLIKQGLDTHMLEHMVTFIRMRSR